MDNRKLMRSRTDKKLFGVCGGIAKYMGCDSTVIRLLFIFITLFVGFGLLTYIIAALLMPEEPVENSTAKIEEKAPEEN